MRRSEKIDVLPQIVSTALQVKVGSCTIQCEVTSTMSTRMLVVWMALVGCAEYDIEMDGGEDDAGS